MNSTNSPVNTSIIGWHSTFADSKLFTVGRWQHSKKCWMFNFWPFQAIRRRHRCGQRHSIVRRLIISSKVSTIHHTRIDQIFKHRSARMWVQINHSTIHSIHRTRRTQRMKSSQTNWDCKSISSKKNDEIQIFCRSGVNFIRIAEKWPKKKRMHSEIWIILRCVTISIGIQ